EVGRTEAAQTSTLCRLRYTTAAVDRNAGDASTENGIVLHTKNSNAGQRVCPKWLLGGKRIISSPSDAKFIGHARIDNAIVADGGGVRFQGLPSKRRRSCTVDDASEGTWDEPLAC